jgi:DNA-binding response OmpR family regulator
LLIVEDDALIARSLGRALEAAGHEVLLASTVAGARGLVTDELDLVLCDLGLPDGDGLDLVAEIHGRRPTLPILVLTARVEEGDIVAGLASGAVDYLTKPFRLAELQARVGAQLRFAAALGGRPAAGIRTLGRLTIDQRSRRVEVDGRAVELRPREFDLLARLAREPGTVIRREELMADVWDEHWWGSTKTLDVHIAGLRSKLGLDDGPTRITTVRGVGYRLDPGE